MEMVLIASTTRFLFQFFQNSQYSKKSFFWIFLQITRNMQITRLFKSNHPNFTNRPIFYTKTPVFCCQNARFFIPNHPNWNIVKRLHLEKIPGSHERKNWNIFHAINEKCQLAKLPNIVDSCTLEDTLAGFTSWLRVRNTEPGTK